MNCKVSDSFGDAATSLWAHAPGETNACSVRNLLPLLLDPRLLYAWSLKIWAASFTGVSPLSGFRPTRKFRAPCHGAADMPFTLSHSPDHSNSLADGATSRHCRLTARMHTLAIRGWRKCASAHLHWKNSECCYWKIGRLNELQS